MKIIIRKKNHKNTLFDHRRQQQNATKAQQNCV